MDAQRVEGHRGQWLGFGITAMGMVSAMVCAYLSQPLVAVSSLVPVVAGILTALFSKSPPEVENVDTVWPSQGSKPGSGGGKKEP